MRDPHKRLLSRRAYYNRNKERLNDEARSERREIKKAEESGIDLVIRLSKMGLNELKLELASCKSDVVRRVINGFIKGFEI